MPLIVSLEVVPLQSFATGVLADVIRRQPPSSARTAFAWELSVGAGIARSTSVEIVGHTLIVRSRDTRWAREVERAADVILQRMQHFLGRGVVTRLEFAPTSQA
jgi:hypothetical protein